MVWPAEPFDKVLSLSLIRPVVQDGFDLILYFAIHKDWFRRRWRTFPEFRRGWVVPAETTDMEHGVYRHVWRQVQPVGDSRDLVDDGVWSQKLWL